LPQFSTLNTEAACSSEKFGPAYQTTRRHGPEDHSMNAHHPEHVKSCNLIGYFSIYGSQTEIEASTHAKRQVWNMTQPCMHVTSLGHVSGVKYSQYVSLVRRSIVSCFNFEFFLPIFDANHYCSWSQIQKWNFNCFYSLKLNRALRVSSGCGCGHNYSNYYARLEPPITYKVLMNYSQLDSSLSTHHYTLYCNLKLIIAMLTIFWMDFFTSRHVHDACVYHTKRRDA
jgi:hypothetical protein